MLIAHSAKITTMPLLQRRDVTGWFELCSSKNALRHMAAVYWGEFTTNKLSMEGSDMQREDRLSCSMC